MDDDPSAGFPKSCFRNSYALSGKIMLCTVVVLCILVVLVVCFHTYTCWFLRRARRLYHHHNRRVDGRTTTSPNFSLPVFLSPQGLDPSIAKSLPTFVYGNGVGGGAPLDCAICLLEFEANETGRVLPKCEHCFHADCIDAWFRSHSDCPLCRTPIKPDIQASPPAPPPEPAEPEHRSVFPARLGGENELGCSSSAPAAAAEQVGITVEVRRQEEMFAGVEDGPGFK